MRQNSVELAAVGVLAFGLMIAAAPSRAGDNNMIHIKQESLGFGGNSLKVDQSQANDSLVIGPSLATITAVEKNSLITDQPSNLLSSSTAPLAPPNALQKGDGNEAELRMVGNGGVLQLQQDNSTGRPVGEGGTGGNWADLSSSGNDTLGAVIQLGNLNNATLILDGNNAAGLISQYGSDLTARLTVAAGGTGQIIQNGEGSRAELDVIAGSNVTYTQNGDYLQPPAGVTVFATNPGTISITQTGF